MKKEIVEVVMVDGWGNVDLKAKRLQCSQKALEEAYEELMDLTYRGKKLTKYQLLTALYLFPWWDTEVIEYRCLYFFNLPLDVVREISSILVLSKLYITEERLDDFITTLMAMRGEWKTKELKVKNDRAKYHGYTDLLLQWECMKDLFLDSNLRELNDRRLEFIKGK